MKFYTEKLVKNSITVLKNDENIIPIQKLEKQKIAYVKIGEDDSTPFLKMLNNYAKVEGGFLLKIRLLY